MPLEVVDLRAESHVPQELIRRHGGWDRPELAEAAATVRRVLADVRQDGDAAVLGYTEKWDGASLGAGRLRVGRAERQAALSRLDAPLVAALHEAAASIRVFHEAQRPSDWSMEVDGRTVGQTYRPIRRVGVYAPGGLAAYPSTVLMTVVPAKVAGVPQVVLCTPPDETGAPSDVVLGAAELAGADEVYRVGGAQAVAAMAYGTQTIRACDKIVGPGSVYVTLAKREVFGVVGIDGLYGPSESLVVADEHADATLAAIELVTQAEHAPDAAAILVTTSEVVLEATLREAWRFLGELSRSKVIRDSLAAHGLAILVRDLEQAADVASELAPEHLCAHVADPDAFLGLVRCAGTVLLGDETAATLSDYCAGPSHVLPTARTARFSSGLSVREFLVGMNVVRYTPKGVALQASVAETLARAEGLSAHAEAVRARLERGDPS